jgi:hypothetical protein
MIGLEQDQVRTTALPFVRTMALREFLPFGDRILVMISTNPKALRICEIMIFFYLKWEYGVCEDLFCVIGISPPSCVPAGARRLDALEGNMTCSYGGGLDRAVDELLGRNCCLL